MLLKTVTDIVGLYNYPQLELITVGNWKVVVRKNNFKLNQLVIYIPIESTLSCNIPNSLIFKNYKWGNKYWIRPIKLANIISSGVVLPSSIVNVIKHIKLNNNIYPYIQNIELNTNINYNVSKWLWNNTYKLIEKNIKIDISYNRLLIDGIKYADSFYLEDNNCKGLLFNSIDNQYNFLIPSLEYYMCYTEYNDYEFNEDNTGDHEEIDLDHDSCLINYEDNDDDVTYVSNPYIETTKGNIN